MTCAANNDCTQDFTVHCSLSVPHSTAYRGQALNRAVKRCIISVCLLSLNKLSVNSVFSQFSVSTGIARVRQSPVNQTNES